MKTNIRNVVSFPLNEETLHQVQPGLFWYDDNTFSGIWIPDKQIKTVVMMVRDHIIYGDSFNETLCLAKNVFLIYEKQVKDTGQKLYFPHLRDFQCIDAHINVLNESLILAGKPIWNGFYFSASDCDFNRFWIKSYLDLYQTFSHSSVCYKFRPLIGMSID